MKASLHLATSSLESRSDESAPGSTERACPTAVDTVELFAPVVQGPWFIEVQDEEDVRRVPVTSAPIVFGSSRHANVVVRDPAVSGRHCEVVVGRGGIEIRDLGSRNGTFVGGARVERAFGGEGTTITIGQSTLSCVIVSEEDQEEIGEPLVGIAGGSVAMCKVATQVRRLADLRAPVLITGETGVGKELVARALHDEGRRQASPFVALNVSALPRELVESELFGHERGAFTGAVARRVGAFAEAEGGTLFLDEIGELPIDAQPKILRALDGYEIRRVGSIGSGRRANARVVAATHVPLLRRVNDGLFRRDLYHRLEVFVLELPPLRVRRGDIQAIARHLLGQLVEEIGRRELSPAAIALLTAHDWPGNVRELRNVLMRAAELGRKSKLIDSSAIERALRRERALSAPAGFALTPKLALEWLRRHEGNVSAAARAAGIPRSSFRKLLRDVSRHERA